MILRIVTDHVWRKQRHHQRDWGEASDRWKLHTPYVRLRRTRYLLLGFLPIVTVLRREPPTPETARALHNAALDRP